MQFRYVPLFIAASLLASGTAWACRRDAPPVTAEDFQYPPVGMLALQAKIEKITPDKPLGYKPHGGFQLRLKVVKVFQRTDFPRTDLTKSLTVAYGGCHNLPGKQGDTINVLAIYKKERSWYAPQFWSRSNESLPPKVAH